MRVLSLTGDILHFGGVELNLCSFAEEFPKLGLEFRVLNVHPFREERYRRPPWSDDFPHYRWLRGPLRQLWSQHYLWQYPASFFLADRAFAVEHLTRMVPKARLPALLIVHNDNPEIEYWQKQSHWRDRILGYVAVSNSIRDNLVHAGVNPEQVWMIPVGIHIPSDINQTKQSPLDEGRLILIYAGRLTTRHKRVLDLVDIVEALNQTDLPPTLEVQLHIAGDGDQRERIAQQLDIVKGRVQIIFHGNVPREKLYQIYNKAHVLLLMSSSEGLSMALREAMLHGVVPVITDIPVNRELIHPGKNGFLFPLGDARTCAARCVQVALSDDYQQMSWHARQGVQEHSTENSARKYAALIRQLAQTSVS